MTNASLLRLAEAAMVRAAVEAGADGERATAAAANGLASLIDALAVSCEAAGLSEDLAVTMYSALGESPAERWHMGPPSGPGWHWLRCYGATKLGHVHDSMCGAWVSWAGGGGEALDKLPIKAHALVTEPLGYDDE